jgi:F0F1-type ATP synthase membrane subunit c/vacuolar-type H+-ATPase subunit K
MLIGQGVSSTPSIFALVVALLVITTDASGTTLVQGFGYLGAGLCIGLATLGGGFGSGFANATACEGVGRHPRRIGGVIRMMIVGQAVTQSASIFALLVAFMLMYTDGGGGTVRAVALLASGVCMGAGGIGPGLGAGLAAGEAARGVSRYSGCENVVLRTMLIGQAVAQSTAIYSLVIALLLIYYI